VELEALKYIKANDRIAIANVTKNNFMGIELLLKQLNFPVELIGGWNKEETLIKDNAFCEYTGKITLKKDMHTFLNSLLESEYPDTIIFPPQSEKILDDIELILEINFTGKIKTIIIIRGYKANLSLEEMKKIAVLSRKNNINIAVGDIKNTGYSIGYLLDSVENMPWTVNELDPDLAEYINKNNLNQGTFLDLGTGAGTQAVELAKLGFTVTATDLVKYAFENTAAKVNNVDFIEDNILDTRLNKKFDYIFDRGCLHALGKENYETYVRQVKKILKDDGILLLKYATNDNKHLTKDVLKYYYSEDELYDFINSNFIIDEIKTTFYQQNSDYTPMKAIFAVLRIG